MPWAVLASSEVWGQQFPGAELGNLTATAILGWYAWHTASRTIPGLLADFRSELAAARTDHRADCEMFRAELAAERNLRRDDQLRLLAALREMTDRWAAPATNDEDSEDDE